MKTAYLVISLFCFKITCCQSITEQIGRAVTKLEKDSQFANAIISMYVVDGITGKPVYEKNAQLGLAPASCQKIITSVTSFELLGKNYQYKTSIKINKSNDTTHLLIEGSGDPTLGSWRWEETKEEFIFKTIETCLKKNNISKLGADIFILENKYDHKPIPDGWVWQDIGNYYGAGARAFNWHENQYDLLLSSGNVEGAETSIKGFVPTAATITIDNYITTGKKGSTDQGYIYSSPNNLQAFATGTIPAGQSRFVIAGSMPDPANVFIKGFKPYMRNAGISIGDGNNLAFLPNGNNGSSSETIGTILSPTLDSINYWFLKKSVNLFGEAFVKTIAYEKRGIGSTDTGIAVIKGFWKERGIESAVLNIIDGSGLSPANRVTAYALVKVLNYAKTQPWFSSFLYALPEINGIKMKDGYIGGVRSYAGYIKSGLGKSYTFSFIVNNFSGNPSTVREKIWNILNLLK